MSDSDINYFSIGTFILAGIALIVAALLIFGSNKLFRTTVYVETYFEESVQGISEGYPVKYRGLQIGYVKRIAFTSEVYGYLNHSNSNGMQSRSIYVLLAITSKLFTNLSKAELNNLINKEVASGLRVKVTPQGLTGTTYIELNYVNPALYPPLKISWRPRHVYIPSAPGAFTQISDNVQHILLELKDVNFKKLFSDTNNLITSLDQSTKKIDQLIGKTGQLVGKVNSPIDKTLKNFLDVSENLRILSDQIKLYPSQLIFGGAPPPLDPGKL